MKDKVTEFATVRLHYDMAKLTERERRTIGLLIDAARIMDELYWEQSLGDKRSFLDGIRDEDTRRFASINYGPWERLNGNKPFVAGFGDKPAGANYYPPDMTKDEFEALAGEDKKSHYTLLRRDGSGKLKVVWYHEAYRARLEEAARLLRSAASFAEDEGWKRYLDTRADALVTSDYQPSDFAWMAMKDNRLDVVVGPIEYYEDGLFGYKAAFESFVLVKDLDWSKRLDKYIALLPMLQRELPVAAEYKAEVPGAASDLGVYDAVYYAGNCNAGSKAIAINLPNDEQVQLKAGSRRLQLKNSMKAKFDAILVPIAGKLIDPAQLGHVRFEAFFTNVMFHEVAHGLGIKNTVNGKGMVRDALKEAHSAFEEAKADILGLFMGTKLIEKGEIADLSAEDCCVTFMAGIFRSVRFGAASSHGKANMMCFNFFQGAGAFVRLADGTYRVDFARMKAAIEAWASTILVLQGNGDYEGARSYLEANAVIHADLRAELDGLRSARIPVDVVFEQGKEVLGLR